MTTTAQPHTPPEDDSIHRFFGLTYSNYLVLPRTLLQSMPGWWQAEFVDLVGELERAFDHIKTAASYKVTAAEEVEAGSLTEIQLKALGISRRKVECTADHDHEADWHNCNDEVLYDSAEEMDMDSGRLVLVPIGDPVPHYRRGRTRVEPILTPGCREVILEMPWSDVMDGDLVLHDGRWVRLEQKLPDSATGPLAIRVLYHGDTSAHQVPAADLTCVKRYAER
jgi:hypothetical protein